MQTYLLLGQIAKVVVENEEYKRIQEAFLLFHQALELAEKQSDTLTMITTLMHIGDAYISLNRFVDPDKIVKEHQQNAKKHLDEAMNLALLKNAPVPLTLTRMAMVRWNNVEKNYAKSLEYAIDVLDNTESIPENYSLLLQVYDHLVHIYSRLGDADAAIAWHNQFRYTMMKESDNKLHRALQEMSVQYETAEKQLEIERQQTEIEL